MWFNLEITLSWCYHSTGNILTFNGASRSSSVLRREQNHMDFDGIPVVSCVILTVSVLFIWQGYFQDIEVQE